MSNRGYGGSRKGSGEKFQKTQHDKAKSKERKTKKSKAQLEEETPVLSISEQAEKTIATLQKLGAQTFALSPFSQYYDDWLVNFRQTIAEFETDPSVGVDEIFVNERARIIADIEKEFAEKRLKEAQLEQTNKVLSDNNHLLVETDATYAHQTHELAAKRNSDIEQSTKKVHDTEEQLAKVKQMKTSFFGFTKKAKAKKEEQTNQALTAANAELEVTVQNFKVEQEKLHDEYERKKQELIAKVQSLESEISQLESDASITIRQKASGDLTSALKAFLQRKETPPQTPS